jgi:hypothetical protein
MESQHWFGVADDSYEVQIWRIQWLEHNQETRPGRLSSLRLLDLPLPLKPTAKVSHLLRSQPFSGLHSLFVLFL